MLYFYLDNFHSFENTSTKLFNTVAGMKEQVWLDQIEFFYVIF
jgi:hypothetical protein